MPWLTDRKWAYIRMEGRTFGDVPLNIELKLEVWDSPNSAGVVIDAVRLAKLALDNGLSGALEGPSSYLMKSPPKQIVDDEACELTEEFKCAQFLDSLDHGTVALEEAIGQTNDQPVGLGIVGADTDFARQPAFVAAMAAVAQY